MTRASQTPTPARGVDPPDSASAGERSRRRLVFGASGYIGTRLVPRLLAEGLPVRVSSRDPALLAARAWPGVEIIGADALQPATLGPALAGVDVAYYLVHSMAAGRDFGRLDVTAARHFAAAAAAAGVRRIVYLGGLVPQDADSEHILSRRDTGNVLGEGAVPVTEIRAGVIVGPGSAAFEVMRDLVYHLPLMITPRWVRATSPPIALDNLLEYLLRVADIPQAAGRTYDAAGPETLSYERMMRVLAEAAGRRPPRIVPVPVLTPRLSAYWLWLVSSVPINVARALIGGLKHDFTADDAELRRLVPQTLLGFRQSVDAAFAAERDSTHHTRWIEGAFSVRNQRLDYAYYAKRASGHATTRASPRSVWAVLSLIGGENRYFYLNSLWSLRELLDGLAGGPGLARGRRHPSALQVGDKVDSWTVLGLEPERRLTLAFGMKAPGAGVLEFDIEAQPGNRTRLTATAYWHPAGALGLMYWYSLAPVHRVIFKGLTREICRQAEQQERLAPPSPSPTPPDAEGG